MAEVHAEKDGAFLLVEKHCPLCAAATACKGFCTSEPDLFRALLGPRVSKSRASSTLCQASGAAPIASGP